MMTDIGIWGIDRESRSSTKLDPANQVDTEEMLEDILTANPGVLMRGLQLVGRQVPVETGYIDLLGIDDEGRLTVFELKREKLTRKAVAQVLDYGSYLEDLSESELATLIVEESGKNGINEITDFDEWYASQWEGSIKPVQMVLVGLGADANARRMVDYLAERGVDIGIVTFHGYAQGDAMLLARQVQTTDDPPSRSRSRVSNQKAVEQEVHRKADEYGVVNLLQDARKSLDYSVKSYYTKSGITYLQRTIILPDDVHVRTSHSVKVDGPGKIRIIFSPGTVDLCHELFEQLKNAIPLEDEPPRNVSATRRVRKQWFCRLDEESWRNHRKRLIDFVRAMAKAFVAERERAMSESEETEEP